jgi:flagellar motility protein MotE (MotC chaperone)
LKTINLLIATMLTQVVLAHSVYAAEKALPTTAALTAPTTASTEGQPNGLAEVRTERDDILYKIGDLEKTMEAENDPTKKAEMDKELSELRDKEEALSEKEDALERVYEQ